MLGILAMKRGDTERAITMLEKGHSLTQDPASAPILLSQAYLAHGESEKAVALMDEVGAARPTMPLFRRSRPWRISRRAIRAASLAQLSGLFKSGAGDLKAGPSLVLSQLRAGKVADAAQHRADRW